MWYYYYYYRKGGVEGAYIGPRLRAARTPAWRATHHARQGAARSAPESPGVASARSTMSTASSCRSEHPGLAHLVAALGHGGAKIVMENLNASKEEQPKRGSKHRNARVSLQRPCWWLSRGPVRRRELQKRVLPCGQRALPGHSIAREFDLGQIAEFTFDECTSEPRRRPT